MHPESPTPSINILMIDDNPVDLYLQRKALETYRPGQYIFEHTDGKGALEFLRNIAQFDAGQLLPDYIFLDLNMPMFDGFQFLSSFEGLGDAIRQKCKVVVLTSSISPLDVQRIAKFSCVKLFVSKPLTPESLAQILLERKNEEGGKFTFIHGEQNN